MAFAGNVNLDGIQTEGRNPRSEDIDNVTTGELCRIINDEDATVVSKVRSCIPIISGAVDALANRVRDGGRVIYVGAGTSGRLGVLDASEMPPTYSASPSQFIGIIAGGDTAIRSAVEGAEDSIEAAVSDLAAVQIGSRDCLIGIAASGRTPYVLSSLEYGKSRGCVTVAIACTTPSPISGTGKVDFMIEVLTGPEVVTGSTRMKAGTATKLVLNMLTTGVMIKIGKTYGNMMIDVKPSNAKLRQRARCMLRAICRAKCPSDDEALDTIIDTCYGSIKLAAVVIECDVPRQEASRLLDQVGGILSSVIGPSNRDISVPSALPRSTEERYYLCVDGGGSRCEAVIYSGNELVGIGRAGLCNVTEVGTQAATIEIRSAVNEALKHSQPALANGKAWTNEFSGVWIAIAGGDRSGIRDSLGAALRESLPLGPGARLRITNDIELPAAVSLNRATAENAVVLVAGTGSVAMLFRRSGNGVKQIGRSGGWGAFLGDDGSGFSIGREALRYSLSNLESFEASSDGLRTDEDNSTLQPLTREIMDFYRLPRDKGSMALLDVLSSPSEGQPGTKKRVASCAKTVIDASMRCTRAWSIVERAQEHLARLVRQLWINHSLSAEKTILILSGGLMSSDVFCQGLLQRIEFSAMQFREIVLSRAPASDGAQYLVNKADELYASRP